jgi:hypothetical protein
VRRKAAGRRRIVLQDPAERAVAKLLELLKRTGMRKGVLGNSRPWFAVWTAITVARVMKKRLGKQPALVERVVLGPGEAVEIRDTGIQREAL